MTCKIGPVGGHSNRDWCSVHRDYADRPEFGECNTARLGASDRRKRVYLVDYVGPRQSARTVRVRAATVAEARAIAAASIRAAIGSREPHPILGVREPGQ